MDAATATALVEESARRSGLVWVRRAGAAAADVPPPRPVWHVWQDGSAYLLTGGIEQPLPEGLDEPGAQAEVTARSKDKGSRLVVWRAAVTAVEPGTGEWDAIVPTLQAKRLNSPDGDAAPLRWARECRVLRLTPVGDALETPDDPSTGSHATPPVATGATTPVRRPWHLFGRQRRTR